MHRQGQVRDRRAGLGQGHADGREESQALPERTALPPPRAAAAPPAAPPHVSRADPFGGRGALNRCRRTQAEAQLLQQKIAAVRASAVKSLFGGGDGSNPNPVSRVACLQFKQGGMGSGTPRPKRVPGGGATPSPGAAASPRSEHTPEQVCPATRSPSLATPLGHPFRSPLSRPEPAPPPD